MIYLLAEPQQKIIKKVFSGKFKKPQISYLFDNTEISSLKDISPVLVADPQVEQSFLKNLLEKNSGLLITSHYSQQEVLDQLRHILLVYFKPDQVGIFRYYDPYIASYFFTHLNDEETANWLGPIEKIEWFNTDWRNKVKQPHQWQQKTNPHIYQWRADPEKLNTKPVLSNNHNLALQDMQQEKFAYHWQQDKTQNVSNSNIDKVICWVKEGIRDGFDEQAMLNNYLAIRAKYPQAQAPQKWPTENLTDRIIYLEYHLTKT